MTTSTETTTLTTFADAERVLAQRLPGYVERPQQQLLAERIERILYADPNDPRTRDIPRHGLFQAGTGTGKSLAYLIPAILSGKRVVIATATKALQEQIVRTDVPLLAEHLGTDFTWAVLKGKSNYACWERVSSAKPEDIPAIAEITAELEAEGFSGDREHFDRTFTDREWMQLSSTTDECLGRDKCPFFGQCKAEIAKAEARDAQLVIVNTALLMMDLHIRQISAGDASILGKVDAVILDEAHELDEIARSSLSLNIRPGGITHLIREADKLARANAQDNIPDITQRLQDAMIGLWVVLEEKYAANGARITQNDIRLRIEAWLPLIHCVQDLRDAVRAMEIVRGGTYGETYRDRVVRRCESLYATLRNYMLTEDRDLARWLEMPRQQPGRRVQGPQLILKGSPVDVAPFLRQMLWEEYPAVLTSATLSVGRDFSYLKDTLGLDRGDVDLLDVGTPFDYATQARTFIPAPDAPSPKTGRAWNSWAQLTMVNLIDASHGGALLLFTSRTAMDQAFNNMAPTLRAKGLTVFKQGDFPNRELARQFAEDTDSVLFALKSFMTGVDFRGDTCRLVVIDKLPFPVPTDVLFQARADEMDRKANRSVSFQRLSIPMMSLTLIQAYGRLIRSVEDYGVVAILDSRLNAGWAKTIVNSLPPAPRVSTTHEIREFFKTHREMQARQMTERAVEQYGEALDELAES